MSEKTTHRNILQDCFDTVCFMGIVGLLASLPISFYVKEKKHNEEMKHFKTNHHFEETYNDIATTPAAEVPSNTTYKRLGLYQAAETNRLRRILDTEKTR